MDYEEVLRSLNHQETLILEGICLGKLDREIWRDLYCSEAQYYILKGNIYAKLNLKDIKERKKRMEILKNVICPIFSSLRENATPTIEIIDSDSELIPPPIEPPPHVIDQESYALALSDTNTDLVGNQGRLRRSPWFAIVVIGVFAIMAGIIGYLLGTRKPLNPPLQSGGIEASATINPTLLFAQNETTSIPTLAPTREPTDSPVITATSTKEIHPTDTPHPTNTQKPVLTLPFTDDFSNALNPVWTLYGDFYTTDNSLTIQQSDQRSWAFINDPTLKNYRLTVTGEVSDMYSGGAGEIQIIVRYNPKREKQLGLVMDWWGHPHLDVLNGLQDSYPIALTDDDSFSYSEKSIYVIEALDNTFTAYVDGQIVASITLDGYDSGGIGLGFDCVYTCPKFSNFKLEPLP